MRFVDTNGLTCDVSPPGQEAEKPRVTLELLMEDDLAVSVQVLQEFYWQVTRASRKDALTRSQALIFLESIRDIPVQNVTLEVFRSAVLINRRFGLSYWDSAILAAARLRLRHSLLRGYEPPSGLRWIGRDQSVPEE